MSTAPPRLAERLAGALIADAAVREGVLGDLAEEHHALARAQGARAADRWYRREVLRSAPGLARVSLARAGVSVWMLLAAAVVAGYAALALLVMGAERLLDRLYGPGAAGDWRRAAASFAAAAICGLAGGYAAAAVGRRAPLLSAAALGAACVLASVLSLAASGGGAAPWHRIGMMVIILPATLGGGVLRVAHRGRRGGPPDPPTKA